MRLDKKKSHGRLDLYSKSYDFMASSLMNKEYFQTDEKIRRKDYVEEVEESSHGEYYLTSEQQS